MSSVPFRSKTSASTVLGALDESHDSPLAAMLELADRCNEVCVHCYQIQGQKGEMTTEQVFRVLDDLARMGVLFLTLSGGEVTLRRDFLEIVRHARKLQFAVKIFTNGLTMTESLAIALAELAVQEVQMSVYSHRAEIHDQITGVPGSWEKTVAGARFLRKHGVAVVIKTPLMSVNAHDYQAYVAFASELGVDFMMDPTKLHPREDGDRSPEQYSASAQAIAEVRAGLAKAGASPSHGVSGERRNERPNRPNRPRRAPADEVCGACHGIVHVEANGEVRPCSQWAVPCGSAVDEGVEQAWRHNEASRLVRALRWGDLHGCRECDISGYCGRCFAKARVSGTDALAPYEEACRNALHRYETALGEPLRVLPREQALPAVQSDTPVLGPFRVVGHGVVQPVEDRLSEQDRERIESYDWIRREHASGAPASHREALVSIRRSKSGRTWQPTQEYVTTQAQKLGGSDEASDAKRGDRLDGGTALERM
jgi:radical SAM protein with 4Fe4S-binding SPASM domain